MKEVERRTLNLLEVFSPAMQQLFRVDSIARLMRTNFARKPILKMSNAEDIICLEHRKKRTVTIMSHGIVRDCDLHTNA
jgi:hypothetical protein